MKIPLNQNRNAATKCFDYPFISSFTEPSIDATERYFNTIIIIVINEICRQETPLEYAGFGSLKMPPFFVFSFTQRNQTEKGEQKEKEKEKEDALFLFLWPKGCRSRCRT